MLRSAKAAKHVSTWVLAIYWIALAVGTHIPKVPNPPGVEVADYVLHFVAYFGLALLMAAYWRARRPLRMVDLLAIVLLVSLYGVIDELTQPIFGRTAAWGDWWADVLGAVTGILLWACVGWCLGFGREADVDDRSHRASLEPLSKAENSARP